MSEPRGLGPKVGVFLPDASMVSLETIAHDPTRPLALWATASPAASASETSKNEAGIAVRVIRRFMGFSPKMDGIPARAKVYSWHDLPRKSCLPRSTPLWRRRAQAGVTRQWT